MAQCDASRIRSSQIERASLRLIGIVMRETSQNSGDEGSFATRFFRTIFGLAMVCVLLTASSTRADDTPLSVMPFYKRFSWSQETGSPTSIYTIAQSRDGFLWLAADEGAFRFDGVTFERMPQTREGSGTVRALYATRSGDVWAGYSFGGVAAYRNGRLLALGAGGPKGPISSIAEAWDGSIWIVSRRQLFRFKGGRWQSWTKSAGGMSLLTARDRTLWAVVENRVHYLKPKEARWRAVGGDVSLRATLAEDPKQRIWVSDVKQVRRVDLRAGCCATLSASVFTLGSKGSMVASSFDRTGRLWLVDSSRKIVRVAVAPQLPAGSRASTPDTVDVFEAPGSAAFYVSPTFEDSEGNMWVGSESGLDRFRPVVVEERTALMPGLRDYVPQELSYQILMDPRGTLYAGVGERLFRIKGERDPERLPVSIPAGNGLCAAASGGVWVRRGPTLLQAVDGPGERFVNLQDAGIAPTSANDSCLEDSGGKLWLANNVGGFGRISGNRWQALPLGQDQSGLQSLRLFEAREGRPLAYVSSGDFHALFDDRAIQIIGPSQIPVREVHSAFAGRRFTFFGGTDGLMRYDGKKQLTLSGTRYPELQYVTGIVQTPEGESWILGKRGLFRIASPELEGEFEHPDGKLAFRKLDRNDGLIGIGLDFGHPNLLLDRTGLLWITTNAGIFSLKPGDLRRNGRAPPVVIRSVSAQGRTFTPGAPIELPKRTSRLAVGFTAFNFAAPDRLRFKYRLLGSDSSWVDAGSRREAIFTNLAPGDYIFEVIAANEDGVWNLRGARQSIAIPATFFQTRWFTALLVAVGLLLLLLLHRVRMNRLAAHLRMGMEQRQQERERIARELHDGLLQTIQGLMLHFRLMSDRIPTHEPVQADMIQALSHADEALKEGRERVEGLRPTQHLGDLSDNLSEIAERIFSSEPIAPVLRVEGRERAIEPSVVGEICAIASEALLNACRHGEAKAVSLTIEYLKAALLVSITDDGVGITAAVANGGVGPAGHFGILGMRERARRIGGTLTMSRLPVGGTLVSISVPSSIAYITERGLWLRFARLLSKD